MSLRPPCGYLSQRYSTRIERLLGVLTDIGTEELAHGDGLCNCTNLLRTLHSRKLWIVDLRYYVNHTLGLWPQSAGGIPLTATFFKVKVMLLLTL